MYTVVLRNLAHPVYFPAERERNQKVFIIIVPQSGQWFEPNFKTNFLLVTSEIEY